MDDQCRKSQLTVLLIILSHVMTTRIEQKFKSLQAANKKAFVSYIMAGDPNYDDSLNLMRGLPQAGVDIIEIGFPFTDPMADGPTIQEAGNRALAGGQTLLKSLSMAREFRKSDSQTPLVMMGYYNPIHHIGSQSFLQQAKDAGVDGLIIVDLPPEEDQELCIPALNAGLNFIRLATPTTNSKRLPVVLQNTSGFVYYVSITGITGATEAQASTVAPDVARIKSATELPVCVGFGIKTPESAKAIAATADGVVVGSSIIERLQSGEQLEKVLQFVAELAKNVHNV